jgi:hypothetical protein
MSGLCLAFRMLVYTLIQAHYARQPANENTKGKDAWGRSGTERSPQEDRDTQAGGSSA